MIKKIKTILFLILGVIFLLLLFLAKAMRVDYPFFFVWFCTVIGIRIYSLFIKKEKGLKITKYVGLKTISS